MSRRGLVVLALLLAALVAWLVRSGGAKPDAASDAAPAKLVAAFREADVRTVEATVPQGAWTLEQASPGTWRVAAPISADADGRRVAALLAAVADAAVTKTVAPAGSDLAPFGLTTPAIDLRVAAGDGASERRIRIGGNSPVGSERYALDAGGSVVLVPGALYDALAHDGAWFRERRLFPVEPASIARIAIDRPDGSLSLVEADGAWRLAAPVADEASTASCDALARAIASLELAEAQDAPRAVPAARERSIRVTIVLRDGGAPRVGYLAAAGIGGSRLGWRDGGALVGLLPESLAREFDKDADAYRSRGVCRFSTPDVRSVAIDRGATRLRVERSSESIAWEGRSGDAPFTVDAERVGDFLARLQRLSAVSFESGAPGTPTGTIVLGGAAGELARLAWGPLPPRPDDHAEAVWITTPARPGVVFRVLATDLGPIPTGAADWAPLPAAGAKTP